MAGCCGCGALRPRYKRLVDNIFPPDPQEGLVKSNMDKLTFFAMKSPEKLDRIGEYLAQRLSRYIDRQKKGFVFIAMEALDTLLVTCHSQTINVFVESFLKMVQKLLEQNDPTYQIVATASFVKFANIEEDTPSYHRRYDFFVSKFSAMCHNNHQKISVQNREEFTSLRVAGLQGLQGVVRKTVSDDLQVNIWEQMHMDKIVPSLLFNMQDTTGLEQTNEEEHPSQVAETVFRDLVCRASYGNINAVIRPVLTHLNHHNLWVPNEFAGKCFKIIMYSVQAQYGLVVVQMLMSHLDANSKKEAKMKASIVDVLSQTVLIAAGGSIGPSVLDVFNTLLRHLRVSVDQECEDEERQRDEEHFQEAVINTIGDFANNLPDYQKIEILMFVMGQVPLPTEMTSPKKVLLQTMLMKTLLKVATKYKTVLMANAFPTAFLEPLLRMSLVTDPGIRRIVQEILQTLFDRHDNMEKLSTVRMPKDIAELELNVEKPQRQDIMFMKKNGHMFYWHLYESMQQSSNKVDNYEALYCTMGLICIEMAGDEVMLELFRLALGIQDMAVKSELPITHKCAVHALVAAYFNLLSQLTAIPALVEHVQKVEEIRRTVADGVYHPMYTFSGTYMLDDDSYPDMAVMEESWLFSVEAISAALEAAGHDVSRLATAFAPQPLGLDAVDLTKSDGDLHSISIDLQSSASTPNSVRRAMPTEKVTFESLKKVLEVNPNAKEEEEERQKRILDTFRNGPFEDIVARSEAQSQHFQTTMSDILEMIGNGGPKSPSNGSSPRNSRCDSIETPPHTIHFPELFVY